ncbi:Fic family protein [Janthinobacterium sp. PLB04]|uniref:Fic family protein n=1 Tax=Janthinobacterium lividum TaxID=29581 RepID=A0AAJ4MNK2_9BURK|nr:MULTISPECIES: Fic family protein [Janthinobacterium]KAB0325107.1 cell filamentation protein Fic [Janthinobacterium lividum]QSX94196.1 Fic family protein [Janthinobacterium lividum]UGQ33964.1 Fic family protein [Janthinobacterium sp. PLB04]
MHLNIRTVQPFAVKSKVGPSRRTVINSIREETYIAAVRPDPTIISHFIFGLKHELINLEFLAKLFSIIDEAVLEDWIRSEPTGAYARRAGFLFEWLTGRRLDVQDTSSGNYVDALDPTEFVVASRASNAQRWRVRDNLPGTRYFCPTIRRTDVVLALEHFNCAAALESLEIQFGADILARSAVWLSIKESRASFAIEKEEKQVDRVKRFAALMEHRCGQNGDPLALQALSEIQAEILGLATRYGVRQSPAVIGYTHGVENIVEYIAPPWERTMELLVGLQRCLAKTAGTSSLLRASIASFGFVYIHPMSDGNDRISRFLVNDVLRRDGAIPAPFILPISATITNKAQQRLGYRRALETLSRPLVSMYQEDFHFGDEYTCPDGARSNFHFDAYDDAMPTWRYPDLTSQTEFLGNIIRSTIEVEMSNEDSYQRDIDRARHAVKGSLEGLNSDIDQIIRSVRDNGWTVSNDLIKKFPQLAATSLAAAVVAAVRNVFQPEAADAAFVVNMKRS